MQTENTERGFRWLNHPEYLEPHDESRLVSESSAIDDTDEGMENPGSSYLWFGDDHHLSREEVAELISHLQYWLDHRRLRAPATA